MSGKRSVRAKLLYANGVMGFAMALFHCFFWELFNWGEDLSKLSDVNAGIMTMSNISMISLMLFQGAVSLVLAKKQGPLSGAEKSVLAFFAVFYFLRAALGFPIFGFTIDEMAVVMVCLAIAAMYMLALKTPREGGMQTSAA